MFKLLKSPNGFSLLEMMVVCSMIAILTTISLPNYFKLRGIARRAEAKSNLGAIMTAEKAFYAEWQQYYTTFEAIGFRPEGNLRYLTGFRTSNTGPATFGAMSTQSKDTNDFCVTNQAVLGSQCADGWGPASVFMASVNSTASTTQFTAEAVYTNLVTPDDLSIDQDGHLNQNSSGY